MGYQLRHIAVDNFSSRPDAEIANLVEAVRAVLPEFAAAWGFAPPGIQFYDQQVELPSEEAIIVSAVDDDGNPDSAGYHTNLVSVPTALWEVGQGPRVFTHEIFEVLVNPLLDRWALAPDGTAWWVEACDATEFDVYALTFTDLTGAVAHTSMSNWLRPAFFGLPNADGLPGFDKMGLISAPFTLRPYGYSVTVTPDGQRKQIGAARPDKGISTSRTAQLSEAMVRSAHALAVPTAPF